MRYSLTRSFTEKLTQTPVKARTAVMRTSTALMPSTPVWNEMPQEGIHGTLSSNWKPARPESYPRKTQAPSASDTVTPASDTRLSHSVRPGGMKKSAHPAATGASRIQETGPKIIATTPS